MTAANLPQDKYKAVWLIFFILGLGTLLPWNFFMTATMYFTSRLVTAEERMLQVNNTGNLTVVIPKNYLESKFNNFMTLCAMVPLLIFSCLNSVLHQRVPQKVRIMGSLAVILLLFLVTAVLVKISILPLSFFVLTMITIVCINSFGAILQGSLFGLAGLLPASYTAPIMSGQGLAGTFAAFAMICAIASGSALQDSAFGYFITACAVILIAIGSYIALPKMEFFLFYLNKDSSPSTSSNDGETKLDLLKKAEHTNGADNKAVISLTDDLQPQVSVVAILKKIWVLAFSVCFAFTVTIGTFPAVTADVKSTAAGDSAWRNYFIPVSCFLLFNLCDWAGRSLTAICLWPGSDSLLLPIMVVARVVFVPLFMLCNVQPRENLPVLFGHDAWYIIFMILFAFSNGYLASLCMCFGPKKVAPHEAETTGAIMAFFLSLGLALGATVSFLFRALV
ncbi:equilibrative nucleoside transporter 1-like isoform X1 [Acipenser oxyrinchus oxyrinchus]|uniref:Equilibrative nucleoside transporter 1-like isoform X1 n=1 Tax=Acipenser oxyrinchus oxyrinchus TaxID=40147 RepID=A0AAD8LLD3_ACIOX|nr:equilibrative nucleoside transporter 1-like isoform X1 [Acipenser oxyrinchus oxyrinchus]